MINVLQENKLLRLRRAAANILMRRTFDHPENRYPSRFQEKLVSLLSYYEIDVVLDVGANVGQYAETLRKFGYRNRIISFEPMNKEFQELTRKADNDPQWDIHNLALGDYVGTSVINISANSASSSMLKLLPRCLESEPSVAYIGKEEIRVATLDSFRKMLFTNCRNNFLKLDVQGFEPKVLDGARESLSNIRGVQIEMSLVPLYQGETLFQEMMERLSSLGFTLMAIDEVFTDPRNGALLQLDGLFFREVSTSGASG